MRNLKFLTFMLFIGLFIGGNGCRKDEVFTSTDILSNSSIQNNFINPSYGYKPVFDTFHLTRNNIHNSDIISIWAPKREHLASLVQELQNIPFSHPMMSKLIEMKKNGIRADINYAMYNPINHEDYFVAVPFFNQNNIYSILVFSKIEDNIDFFLCNSSNLESLIQGTPNPEDNLPFIASFHNAIQYAKSKSVNLIINEFLFNISEPNNRFLGTRQVVRVLPCTTYTLNGTEEHIVVSERFFTAECPSGGGVSSWVRWWHIDDDSSSGGGSGSGGEPTIPNTVEKECIKILSPAIRKALYELFETYENPCDDDPESTVAEAINKECAKNTSSSNDTDGRDREISVNDAIDEKEFLNNIINELYGTGSTLDQTGIIFSASNPICEELIEIIDAWNNPNTQSSVGLQNLNISLNNGVAVTFNYLSFNFPKPKIDCNPSSNEMFKMAFNAAIRNANNNLSPQGQITISTDKGGAFPNNSTAFAQLIKIELINIARNSSCYIDDNGNPLYTDSMGNGIPFNTTPVLTNSPSRAFDCAPSYVNYKNITKPCP